MTEIDLCCASPLPLYRSSRQTSLPVQLARTQCGTVSRSLRAMISTHKLEQGQRLVLELPTIVFVGGKHSGKFEVVGDVLGISLHMQESMPSIKHPIRLQFRPLVKGAQPSVTINSPGQQEPTHVSTDQNQPLCLSAAVAAAASTLGNQFGLSEIVVTICEADSIGMDIVVLPAPVVMPEAERVRCNKISAHYLHDTSFKQRNVLVVCVVNAAADLSVDMSLKNVMDADKLSSTILVFANTQQLSAVQTTEQVIPKLTGDSTDGAILDGSLACIATADFKDTLNDETLDEQTEHTYFRFVLTKLSAPYNSLKQRLQLKQSMTVEALVVKLAQEMDRHIQRQWKPVLISYVDSMIEQVGPKTVALGVPADSLTTEGVLEAIHKAVDWPKFFADISKADPIQQLEGKITIALLSIPDVPHESCQWLRRVVKSEAAIQAAVRAATAPETFAPMLNKAYMEAFAKDTPEKWNRFSSLKTLVIGELLPQRLLETLHPNSQFSKLFVEPLLTQVSIALCSSRSPKISYMPFMQLHHQVRSGIMKELYKQFCAQPLGKAGFELQEDSQTQAERAHLAAALAELDTVHILLEGITASSSLLPCNRFLRGLQQSVTSEASADRAMGGAADAHTDIGPLESHASASAAETAGQNAPQGSAGASPPASVQGSQADSEASSEAGFWAPSEALSHVSTPVPVSRGLQQSSARSSCSESTWADAVHPSHSAGPGSSASVDASEVEISAHAEGHTTPSSGSLVDDYELVHSHLPGLVLL